MGEERETEKEKGEGMEKEGGRDGGRGDFHLVSREPIRPLAASCLTQLLSLDTLVHQLFQYHNYTQPTKRELLLIFGKQLHLRPQDSCFGEQPHRSVQEPMFALLRRGREQVSLTELEYSCAVGSES